MKTKNTIENLDIGRAIKIIRDDIGYTTYACIDESIALAAFLHEMDIPCRFEFGEAIYIPREAWAKQYYRVAHRDYRVGMKPDEPAPFHCWLNVNGKVLDISIGSWTLDLPKSQRLEYIYGDYHKGFQLTDRFNRYDVGNVVTSTYCYSYNKFKSRDRIRDLVADGDKYQTNLTMYQDLGFPFMDINSARVQAFQYRYC